MSGLLLSLLPCVKFRKMLDLFIYPSWKEHRLSTVSDCYQLGNAFAASILLWCFPTIIINNADEDGCKAGNKSRQSVHSAFFFYVLLNFLRDMHLQINREMNIIVGEVARRVTFQKHISVFMSQWRQKRKLLRVITLQTGLLCVVRIGCGRSR